MGKLTQCCIFATLFFFSPLSVQAEERSNLYVGFTQGTIWVKAPELWRFEQKYAAMGASNGSIAWSRAVENRTGFKELVFGYCFSKFFCGEYGRMETGNVYIVDTATSTKYPVLSAKLVVSASAIVNRYSLVTKFPINEHIVPQIKVGVLKYAAYEEAKLYPSEATFTVDGVQGLALFKEQQEVGSVLIGSAGVLVNYKKFGLVFDYSKTSSGGILSEMILIRF